MNVATAPTLRPLIVSTIIYMVLALVGTAIAISQNLPAQFAGSSTGLTAPQDFLYGMGTALSPPLYTLVTQLAFLLLTPRKDRWGTVGVLGLALIGLMTSVGALSELINLIVVNPATFDALQGIIITGMIMLPLVIMVFAILEWSGRRKRN